MTEQPTGRLRWRIWYFSDGMAGGRVLQQEWLIDDGVLEATWHASGRFYTTLEWRDVPTEQAENNEEKAR